jgi:two-component system sensor histidine kinase DesK
LIVLRIQTASPSVDPPPEVRRPGRRWLGLVVVVLLLAYFSVPIPHVAEGKPIWVLLNEIAVVVGLVLAAWFGLTSPEKGSAPGIVLLIVLVPLVVLRASYFEAVAGFTYLGIIAALVLPMKWTPAAIGLITAVQIAVWNAISAYEWTSMIGFAFQTLLLGFATLGVRKLIYVRAQLSRAREELVELAVSEQRLRFAADLHDIVGHRLGELAEQSSAIREQLNGSAADISPVARELEDVELVARRAMVEVADVAGGYAGRSFDDQLGTAMRLLRSAGVQVTYTADAAALTEPVETLLGYVVREAATNVARHSGADSCGITLCAAGGFVELEVVDNGIGRGGDAQGGSGLIGLRERVAAQSGSLEAGPLATGGFRLAVRVRRSSST